MVGYETTCSSEIEFESWIKVRHSPNDSWNAINDQLAGIIVNGNPADDS